MKPESEIFIPYDVLTELFFFIPLKDMVNFQCTSKAFNEAAILSIKIREKIGFSEMEITISEFADLPNNVLPTYQTLWVIPKNFISLIYENKNISLENKTLLFKYSFYMDYFEIAFKIGLEIFFYYRNGNDVCKKEFFKDMLHFLFSKSVASFRNNKFCEVSAEMILKLVAFVKKNIGMRYYKAIVLDVDRNCDRPEHFKKFQKPWKSKLLEFYVFSNGKVNRFTETISKLYKNVIL